MTVSSLGTFFLLFFFLAAVASVSSQEICSYKILVKTGTEGGANSSTDAKIGVLLNDAKKSGLIVIVDLTLFGMMGSGHNYFESGNIDSFGFRAPCKSLCSLTLQSDNKGESPSWYVDYFQVLTSKDSSKAPSGNITFDIYGWLAKDHSPYILRRSFNLCCPRRQQITDAII